MNVAFQITRLTAEIATSHAIIQANREKIRRLENAKTKITEGQSELHAVQNKINQPELSTNLWHGKHANDFLERREAIKEEYGQIKDTKVNDLLDNISRKIGELESANATISDSIQFSRTRLTILQEMED